MVTLENIKTDPLTFQSHLLVFPLGAAMGSGIINPFLALPLTVFPRLIGHVLQGQVNTNTVKKHLKNMHSHFGVVTKFLGLWGSGAMPLIILTLARLSAAMLILGVLWPVLQGHDVSQLIQQKCTHDTKEKMLLCLLKAAAICRLHVVGAVVGAIVLQLLLLVKKAVPFLTQLFSSFSSQDFS